MITRDDAQLASARFSDARVFIDGRRVALLSNAQRVRIELDPGEHTLDAGQFTAENGNGRAVETMLKPGQIKYFRLKWEMEGAQIYPTQVQPQ